MHPVIGVGMYILAALGAFTLGSAIGLATLGNTVPLLHALGGVVFGVVVGVIVSIIFRIDYSK